MIINIKNNKILIDDEDYELVKDKIIGVYNGYVSVSKTTGYKRLHRLVMKVNDPKIHIDHINHNRLDNRKCNLRVATLTQNNRNTDKRKTYANELTTSKYKGVRKMKSFQRRKLWFANIQGKCIGYFHTENEAAIAYNKKALEIFDDFANLNIIEKED